MKILIACSSSLGHINPALIFGNYLKNKGHHVTYLGIKGEMEENILKNHDKILLNIKKSFKKNIYSIKSIIKYFTEIKAIRKQVKDYDIYIGFGGFINSVLLFLDKKPLFVHEQNIVLGDTNKLCKTFSKKVFYSFIRENQQLIINNPTCELIKKREFEYKDKLNILFVFGSLGSSSLIKKLKENEDKLDNNHKYTLVTDKENKYIFNKIKTIGYVNLKKELYNYDLIICRGGASTLSEIISSNTNCITIPSPYVKNNHQEKNVDYLVNLSLVSKLKEKDFNYVNLNKKINEFINYDFSLMRYKNMKNVYSGNVCERIYKEILAHV